jgi:hypothetical protein
VIRSLNIPTPAARSFDGMTIQTGASGANSYNLNINAILYFYSKITLFNLINIRVELVKNI